VNIHSTKAPEEAILPNICSWRYSLLENGIYLFLQNLICILITSKLENLMCSRNLFRKVNPGKKKYFSKIARLLLILNISYIGIFAFFCHVCLFVCLFVKCTFLHFSLRTYKVGAPISNICSHSQPPIYLRSK